MEFGVSFKEIKSRKDTQWIDLAFEHLKIIQQKKLFDAQCLWRAEQLTINEVEICYDFSIWENDILNCPFIESVSEDDINLYQDFLNSNADEDDFIDWQNYDDIKEAYHNEESANINFPEWYAFCIARTGGSGLLALPNIKEEIEDYYLSAWRNQPNPEREKLQAEWELNFDKRPSIDSIYENKFLDWFVKTYETPADYSYFKVMLSEAMMEDEDYYMELIGKLLRADEPIPVSANMDWKDALNEAYSNYSVKKIIAYLPLAYEQYSMQRDLNIYTHNDLLAKDGLRKEILNHIAIGKKLLGETD